jgi:hypothetical protein
LQWRIKIWKRLVVLPFDLKTDAEIGSRLSNENALEFSLVKEIQLKEHRMRHQWTDGWTGFPKRFAQRSGRLATF